jgi:hypothetical protein
MRRATARQAQRSDARLREGLGLAKTAEMTPRRLIRCFRHWVANAPAGLRRPVTSRPDPRSISMRGSSIGVLVLVLLAVAIAAFLLAPGSGRKDTSRSSPPLVHSK